MVSVTWVANTKVVSLDLPSEEGAEEDPVSELIAAGLMLGEARVNFRGSNTVIVLESAPFSVSWSASERAARPNTVQTPSTTSSWK